MELHISDEISRLRAVVLGIAHSNGPTPKYEDTYDPKSASHVLEGTYPLEKDMVKEIESVAHIFEKYGVLVDALYDGSTHRHIRTEVTFEDGRTGAIEADLEILDAKTFPPISESA